MAGGNMCDLVNNFGDTMPNNPQLCWVNDGQRKRHSHPYSL